MQSKHCSGSIIGSHNILVNTNVVNCASTCFSFHAPQAEFVEEVGQNLLDGDWQAPTSKFQEEYSKIKFNAGIAFEAINQSKEK